MSIKDKLGQRIKEVLKLRKLTQEKLAEFVGIDTKNISKIENGNNYPSADTIVSIAKALDVNVYELFIFDTEIDYESMRKEIIQSLGNKNTVVALYKTLKGLK